MKTFILPATHRRRQEGSAVIMVLAMLAIMLICVGVNTVAVTNLRRELKLLEKKQVQRLQPAAANQSENPRQNARQHD